MAEQDFAILVGIARYRDTAKYPTLQGPCNDVEDMWKWLNSKTGGNIDAKRIIKLATPADIATLPDEGWPEDTRWTPNREVFSDAFKRATLNNEGEFARSEGRLYLYFSGHGFSQQSDQVPRAALYSADCYGKSTSNLAGTLYAEAVKRASLYKEVVLIMDCCRDAENNVEYNNPELNKVQNDNTENVRVYAAYAAPKMGKAQERELPEADGKVGGLMTHAWLRALKEAPCDVEGRVHGKVLMQYISFKWSSWYKVDRPPTPRIIGPDEGDVAFPSGKELVTQRFLLPASVQDGAQYRLTSTTLNATAQVNDNDKVIVWQDANFLWESTLPLIATNDGFREFSLKLPHVYNSLFTEMSPTDMLFLPGATDAITL